MKQDTIDFLSMLLELADDPDQKVRPFLNKTVYDFSPEFQAGAEKFVDAFRAHLTGVGFPVDKLDHAERSFGGNVYFSLSGHGCGFFDDCDPEIAGLQQTIQEWSAKTAGTRHRFEELESDLDIGKDGKIDLCVLPGYLQQYRDALFAVPEPEKAKPDGVVWYVSGGGVYDGQATVSEWPSGTKIALIYNKKNAPVSAAGPELLSALEGVMRWWREVPLPDGGKVDEMPADIFDAALNAIAKAKGGAE